MSRYFLFALALGGCLEGDPNPYDMTQSQGGSGNAPIGISPGSACSQTSDLNVSLTLNNRSARSLNVFWVDYNCAEQAYGTLAPGGNFATSTHPTHPWRLRDAATGTLVFEYVTGPTSVQNVDVNVP
jgi:hypothetical protein